MQYWRKSLPGQEGSRAESLLQEHLVRSRSRQEALREERKAGQVHRGSSAGLAVQLAQRLWPARSVAYFPHVVALGEEMGEQYRDTKSRERSCRKWLYLGDCHTEEESQRSRNIHELNFHIQSKKYSRI